MGDYHLVRVGVSPELLRILRNENSGKNPSVDLDYGNCCFGGISRLLSGCSIRRWHQNRIAERRRQQQLLEEEEIRRKFIEELLVDRNHSYFVTEEQIPLLEGWSFRGYLEEDWVRHMMGYAELNHFLILGKNEYLPRLLLQYMKRIKSLKWVLLKRQFGEREQALVEEVYEEYGLAIEVRLLEEEADYRKMRMVCRVPVAILDFCEEERISATDIERGSIWLDMTSSEIKRRRLEDRDTGIAYFSLKKEWKQPQNMADKLDTTGKNGYNTLVN